MDHPSALALALGTALALGAGGCSDDPLLPVDELPAPLQAPELSTAGWETVSRPDFTLPIPPGFEDLGLQPIDSDAAVFQHADGSTVQYDHGVYTAPPRVPEGATEVLRDVHTAIGGKEVVLLAYRSGASWFVAARWPGVGESGLGEPSLLVAGETEDAAVRDRILAAIHGVRFP